MPMPLEKWQERLERHFELLARTRAGQGFPVFGLEHGLTEGELAEISSLLRSRLRSHLPLPPHWLLWVIYSTEHGYGYKGDEYWHSFEEQTTGWDFSDRYRVVSWFKKFQKAYDGVVPSGPWAAYFKIIAWPITHAVLPRYLQREFAKTLFDLRFRLAGLDTLTPDAIGRLLAANADHASSRLREFFQQEELTGRIVLGLLGQTPAAGMEPIYTPTLQRIVSDLETVRSTREWLKETQRVVTTDRFKGIGRGTGPPGLRRPLDPDGGQPADRTLVDVRPSLLLRYAGAATWSIFMEIPSFRNCAALNADTLAFLRRTRCRLNGAYDTKPAGWLLSGIRKGILKSWPDPGKPLIQFEQPQVIIDHLLESECRLSAGPVWLFRLAPDGTAREIVGRIVRPGRDYILLTVAELPQSPDWLSPCSVDCSGIKSFRLVIPKHVSAEDTAWLHKLGLQVARTIRVWPAGLPGRRWDGEGSSEWLTTESPCFGIVHDHPVDAYVISLDHGPEKVIEAGAVGNPLFVRLDPLFPGTHSLTVKARRSASLDAVAPSPLAEGFIQLNVREPEPWIPGALSHPGLLVTLDPQDADLDTFWKNEVSLSVLGPESHSVTFAISLVARDGCEIFSAEVASHMDLPITPDAWSKRFAQFVRRKDCSWNYLEAASGRLTIKGEELGECSFHFEHDVRPLRWVLHYDHNKIILRLIDDTGQEGSAPGILFFSMEHPLKAASYPPEAAFSGITVTSPGGLFLAHHGEHRDTVVISAGLTAEGLSGLGVTPDFTELHHGSALLADSLALLSIWHDARLTGLLSDIRHQKVMEGLHSVIYEMLCGSHWAKAEAAFKENPHSQPAIDRLQRGVHTHAGFGAVLRRDFAKMNGDFVQASHWYAELAARYGICTDSNLCDFALRLASQPQGITGRFGSQLEGLLAEVRKNPMILRGARLLALLCANQNRSGPALLLPRWKW